MQCFFATTGGSRLHTSFQVAQSSPSYKATNQVRHECEDSQGCDCMIDQETYPRGEDITYGEINKDSLPIDCALDKGILS